MKYLLSWNHLSVEMNPGPGFEKVYDFFLSLPLKTSRRATEKRQCIEEEAKSFAFLSITESDLGGPAMKEVQPLPYKIAHFSCI